MEEVLTDEQSHYEISLTAGQAFVAFVLLLLSLAASFAFGLLIGRGQTDDHLAIKGVTTAVATAPAKPVPVEKQVSNDDFKAPDVPAPKPTIEPAHGAPANGAPANGAPANGAPANGAPALAGPRPAEAGAPSTPVFAQLLSTSDQKTAESLAAKLIEGGFSAAYVERTTSEKGTVFRVRVKFPSDADARAAEAKLKQFSKEVWITR